MPFTMERLDALLTEHEEIVRRTRSLYDVLAGTISANDITAEDKLYNVSAALKVLLDLPGHAHQLERVLYRRNIRRNMKSRAKQRNRRRMAGTNQYHPPGSPQEIEAELSGARATTGMLLSELHHFAWKLWTQSAEVAAERKPVHRSKLMEFLAFRCEADQAYRMLEMAVQMGWLQQVPKTLLFVPKPRGFRASDDNPNESEANAAPPDS